jgi:hypothetical protein
VGHQAQLNHLARSDRSVSWIHILFLFAVSITPFSTTLLAEFTAYRVALLTSWANIVALGAALDFTWTCATGSGLVKAEVSPHVSTGIKRAKIDRDQAEPAGDERTRTHLLVGLSKRGCCGSAAADGVKGRASPI